MVVGLTQTLRHGSVPRSCTHSSTSRTVVVSHSQAPISPNDRSISLGQCYAMFYASSASALSLCLRVPEIAHICNRSSYRTKHELGVVARTHLDTRSTPQLRMLKDCETRFVGKVVPWQQTFLEGPSVALSARGGTNLVQNFSENGSKRVRCYIRSSFWYLLALRHFSSPPGAPAAPPSY